MAFLKYELENYSILDAKVKTAEFMKANGITSRHMIFKMEFDKSVFVSMNEVLEYLQNKFFCNADGIEETEKSFIYNAVHESQMDKTLEVKTELRRGLTVIAAPILSSRRSDEINYFNEKGVTGVYYGYSLKEISLSEKDAETPVVIELARVIEGEHALHGKVVITKEELKSFEKNFNDRVTDVDIAVNEDHKKEEAFGWILEVFLSDDKETLYGKVKWNKKGITALSEKEYRYFSPELNFSYVHPHSKKKFGPTLVGGALTNYPFLKMGAIVSLNEKSKGNNAITTNKEDIMPKEIELKLNEQNNKITGLSEKLTNAVKVATDLSNKVAELEKEKAQMKEEQEYKELFDKGLINAAQFTALKEGKSAKEVLLLSTKTNTAPKGSSETPKETIELSDGEKSIIEKLGLTPEEYNQYSEK